MLTEQRNQETETDRFIGEVVIYLLVGALCLLFFLPALLGMLFFSILYFLKRDWISYFAFAIGIIILFWQFKDGQILSYFGLISEMNIPYMSTGVEKLLNKGHSISVTDSSYFILVGLALIFSFGFFIFAKYFWKKRVTTKAGRVQKQKSEQKYKAFRKNRVKFLNKKQMQYRKKYWKQYRKE